MKKIRVAVLFGGCSAEYEVSLQSAYSVITNINNDKYEVLMLGITKEGNWYRYFGEACKIQNDTWHLDLEHCVPAVVSPNRDDSAVIEFHSNGSKTTRIDIAFPVLHGKNGEDGTVQGLLELAGIPFVGCGTLSSAICMDKDRSHKLAEQAGIKVPASVVLSGECSISEALERTRHLRYPLFVKPVKAGSSFGITKIFHEQQLSEAVKNASVYDNEVIIEENIDGFEVGCAVLGNDELMMGEVDEIELTGGFFDYEEKYSLKYSRIHMPARIDEHTSARVKETAAVLYRALSCCGFARVDMFLTPDKEIVFNEVNTIPGFTAHSRYPNMMKGIGLEFPDLLGKLIQLGFER